jgi:hypothetical protein
MQARQPGPAYTHRQKEISKKTDTERNGTPYCKRLQKNFFFYLLHAIQGFTDTVQQHIDIAQVGTN